MSARYFKQESKYGVLLDMLIDRIAKCSFLLLLAYFESKSYNHWSVFYCIITLIDLVSHWTRMYTSFIMQKDSHKQTLKNENYLIRLYYEFPGMLFFCVLGSEAYLCMTYLKIYDPKIFETYGLMKIGYAVSIFVFGLKIRGGNSRQGQRKLYFVIL